MRAAPFRPTSVGQLHAHLGQFVEVDGIAVRQTCGPHVLADSAYYDFQLKDLDDWPAGAVDNRVLVTGRLVLKPGLTAQQLKANELYLTVLYGGGPVPYAGLRSPSYALEDVRWKLAKAESSKPAVLKRHCLHRIVKSHSRGRLYHIGKGNANTSRPRTTTRTITIPARPSAGRATVNKEP